MAWMHCTYQVTSVFEPQLFLRRSNAPNHNKIRFFVSAYADLLRSLSLTLNDSFGIRVCHKRVHVSGTKDCKRAHTWRNDSAQFLSTTRYQSNRNGTDDNFTIMVKVVIRHRDTVIGDWSLLYQ